MGGHVNMMDDVLISNLPPEYLRSALRTLVSQGSVTQRPFVQHVRQRLSETAPELPLPKLLFPDGYNVTLTCKEFLSLTRCMFSCKLVQQSLHYLEHFLSSIREARACWSPGSELEATMETFGGDIVQAMQALKESKPSPTTVLEQQLMSLVSSLQDCDTYCRNVEPHPLTYPFARAERQVLDTLVILYPKSQSRLKPEPSTTEVPSITSLSTENRLEYFMLGPIKVPRLFNGLWQLSSPAWGSATAEKQESALVHLTKSGFTATDMADHYGDAELVYGCFRNRVPQQLRKHICAASKWCVFSPVERPIDGEWVLGAVRERCRRVDGRVELLQFHWYDYAAKEYLQIIEELVSITKSHPELLGSVGLCNFDAEHTQEACEYLLARTGSVGLVSNQVQFSLVDSRPLKKMCPVCAQYGLRLLTYGSFSGGFLSSKWLGQPEPELYSDSTRITPSQRKYLGIIHDWGSWGEFQSLLRQLLSVASKYNVALTNVATRWVLQQPRVGAVIVGTRLGISLHAEENLCVFGFHLDRDDLQAINQIALGNEGEKTESVFGKLGDCGSEYRAMH
ncbi:aldo/keto reductase [Biscogniauxia marginata]|nr:aldo/keto reductase [Biscogniauxia marginata]